MPKDLFRCYEVKPDRFVGVFEADSREEMEFSLRRDFPLSEFIAIRLEEKEQLHRSGKRLLPPKDIVDAHLRGCLPPGVPPSYQRVISAEKRGTGRNTVWAATLLMFDNREGRVEVFKAGRALEIDIWGHRWTDLPGGSVSYEGGRWIRIDPETLEPFPEQADLFAAAE